MNKKKIAHGSEYSVQAPIVANKRRGSKERERNLLDSRRLSLSPRTLFAKWNAVCGDASQSTPMSCIIILAMLRYFVSTGSPKIIKMGKNKTTRLFPLLSCCLFGEHPKAIKVKTVGIVYTVHYVEGNRLTECDCSNSSRTKQFDERIALTDRPYERFYAIVELDGPPFMGVDFVRNG